MCIRDSINAQYMGFQVAEAKVSQENTIVVYSNAVKCAILAPAGPKRNQILKNFYNDKNIQDIGGQIYNMLEKKYMGRIITNNEKNEFSKLLKVHQNCLLYTSPSPRDQA
eukprot:TRINITY_DN29607_c0_g1_i1.p1 TRINITY_DN29607_c0_g1~~TRINITY_DN29607_c0_g1_i1.p1  ORF type:complete len:125 (+),score=28.11 TRINITY_DN29607_c0_g1_i1:48-377(+)